MSFDIQANGVWCKCHVTDLDVCFSPDFDAVKINIEDIIGCEVVSTSWLFDRPALKLWHIVQMEDHVLMKAKIQITGEENVWRNLKNEIQDKLAKLTKRPKSLLVLINPIGGKKRAVKEYQNTVSPIFSLADIKCDVHVSKRPKQMVDIIKKYDTSGIDGIVILGGDGSYAEVTNVLLRKAQEEAGIDCNDPRAEVQPIKIPIGMIPTGTGNYVAGRTTGCTKIVTSTLHVIRGLISHLNVLGVYADGKLVDYCGVCVTQGLITEITYYSDVKYRWLGSIRYYVAPLRFLLTNSGFKTYNIEVTCYTHGTDGKESVRVENDELFMYGRKVQHFTLTGSTRDSVSFKGQSFGVMSWCGSLINPVQNVIDWENLYRQPQTVFSTLFYNSRLTISKLLNQIKEILGREQSQKDDFHETAVIRGLKVRVTDKDKGDGSMDDLIRHLLMVDGEIYKINDVEYQLWVHENIVPVFTKFRG